MARDGLLYITHKQRNKDFIYAYNKGGTESKSSSAIWRPVAVIRDTGAGVRLPHQFWFGAADNDACIFIRFWFGRKKQGYIIKVTT
jgi:hypothetical protein